MRSLALVVTLATVLAIGLRVSSPEPPLRTASITALAVPSEAFVGERFTIRGSASIEPGAPAFRAFSVCVEPTASCTVIHRGWLPDPGEWSGVVGSVRFDRPGVHRVIWTLFEPWS